MPIHKTPSSSSSTSARSLQGNHEAAAAGKQAAELLAKTTNCKDMVVGERAQPPPPPSPPTSPTPPWNDELGNSLILVSFERRPLPLHPRSSPG
ncbi:unnamed protein product [Sphagnum tenellum]